MSIKNQIERAQAETSSWSESKRKSVQLEGKSDYIGPIEPQPGDKCLNRSDGGCSLGSMFCAYPDCEN